MRNKIHHSRGFGKKNNGETAMSSASCTVSNHLSAQAGFRPGKKAYVPTLGFSTNFLDLPV